MESERSSRPSINSIIATVSAVTKVSVDAIRSTRRDVTSVTARHLAFHLLDVVRVDMAIPALARMLNVDHSTLLHARRAWPSKAGLRHVREWLAHPAIRALLAPTEPKTLTEAGYEAAYNCV